MTTIKRQQYNLEDDQLVSLDQSETYVDKKMTSIESKFEKKWKEEEAILEKI